MDSKPSLPRCDRLSTLSVESQTGALDLLFEPSQTLHDIVRPSLIARSFDSYNDLVNEIHTLLMSLPPGSQDLHAILGSHPRLGAPKVESAQSAAEQAKLRGNTEETARLAELNAKYEATFPGLRFVVFVNGRGRPEIMANMEERIARRDPRAEEVEAINVGPCGVPIHLALLTAIQAMCAIAKDRANKLPVSPA